MKDRVAIILGSTASERKAIKERVGKLYDLRSRLVHGNQLLGSLPHDDLRDLRQFARRVTLWFANWLDSLHPVLEQGDVVPTRQELLRVPDFEAATRQRMRVLIDALPSWFPRVHEWCD